MNSKSELLILGYGNPARGDDALAPELIHLLQDDQKNQVLTVPFDTLNEFQLQIENTLDLEKYPLVLLVDAIHNIKPSFTFTRVRPSADRNFTDHALTPSALLSVFQKTSQIKEPRLFLLAISGQSFELGESLLPQTKLNLTAAHMFTQNLIRQQSLAYWTQCITE